MRNGGHVTFLEACGISAWYDRNLKEGENFHSRIRDELRAARRVIVIWTRSSVNSDWVNAEAMYVQELRTPLIQLIWEKCQVPPPFNVINGTEIANLNDDAKARVLAAIGARPEQAGRRRTTFRLTDVDMELGTIPGTQADILFGRQTQIDELVRQAESGETRISVIHALGGEGKTSLLNYWIRTMQARAWCGARRVFGWSFYVYGAEDRGQASADRFFDEALAFFGYDGEALQISEAKARELSRLLRRDKTILILDGLEPLQHLTGSRGAVGRLRDPGLRRLLRDILLQPDCFCLVTTRVELGDLRDVSSPTMHRLRLPPLPTPDAVAFLRHLGVVGKDRSLEAAVDECRGHALTLSLLGRYLHTVHRGNIEHRKSIAGLAELDLATDSGERSVTAMMAHYEREYLVRRAEVERGAPSATSTAARQLALLRLLGLSERHTEWTALMAVISAQPVTDLTDVLSKATDGELRFALQGLSGLGLISFEADIIDAHPLVRRYFKAVLSRPALDDARRAAHRALFRYYEKAAHKSKLTTIAELDPWLQAVLHACQALDLNAAYAIYVKIDRGREHALTKKLGAHNTNIELLSTLLSHARRARDQLDAKTRGELWGLIASSYQALGRTGEAEAAYARSFAMSRRNEIRAGIALMAQFQADLAGERGEITRAIRFGNVAVDYGPRDLKDPNRVRFWANLIATYGSALDKGGRVAEARKQFQILEQEVARAELQNDVMRGRIGFKVFQHYISVSDVVRAEALAKLFAGPARRGASLVSRGLEWLCLARLALVRSNPAKALDVSETALDAFWRGAEYSAIIRGLMMRGAVLGALGRFVEGRRDYGEASELATESELYALQADIQLGIAELVALEVSGAPTPSRSPTDGKLRDTGIEAATQARALMTRLKYVQHLRRLGEIETILQRR